MVKTGFVCKTREIKAKGLIKEVIISIPKDILDELAASKDNPTLGSKGDYFFVTMEQMRSPENSLSSFLKRHNISINNLDKVLAKAEVELNQHGPVNIKDGSKKKPR